MQFSLNLIKNKSKFFIIAAMSLLVVLGGAILVPQALRYRQTKASSPDDFIITLRVAAGSNTVQVPVYNDASLHLINNVAYDYTINWGDGSPVETFHDNTIPEHTYAATGDYQVAISGQFPGWTMHHYTPVYDETTATTAYLTYTDADWQKFPGIISVDQWGTNKWQNMTGMFMIGSLRSINATDRPDTIAVKDMSYMFSGAENFDSPVNIDTSNVEDMSYMFNYTNFNHPLPSFDTSKVKNMERMFESTYVFNQPLDNFDTSEVVNMKMMFRKTQRFNQPLPNFNTEKVTSMKEMFDGAVAFDQDVSHFNFLRDGLDLEDFVSNSGLSVGNYDKLLMAWYRAAPSMSDYKKPISAGLRYCTTEAERLQLEAPIASGGYTWGFMDAGKDCSGWLPPVINGEHNFELVANQVIAPDQIMDQITAYDDADRDLTGNVVYQISPALDLTNPQIGDYVVTYSVTDITGLTTTKTINLKIKGVTNLPGLPNTGMYIK